MSQFGHNASFYWASNRVKYERRRNSAPSDANSATELTEFLRVNGKDRLDAASASSDSSKQDENHLPTLLIMLTLDASACRASNLLRNEFPIVMAAA
jgi:hypothetical protein